MNEFKPHDYFKVDDQGYISRKVFIEHIRNTYDHMRELANLIKGYDETIDAYLEQWDQNLESLDDSVIGLLHEWIDDSTFATIINEEIFNTKADQADLENVTAQLQQKVDKTATDLAINMFNETDRAVLQGMEPGQINAVLGVGNVTPINTNFFKRGKNLFNKSTVRLGQAINQNGELIANDSFNVSDFIQVEPNATYIRLGGYGYAFFTENKEFISYGSGATMTAPPNAHFLIITIGKSIDLNTYQLEKGSIATDFEPYHNPYISSDKLELKIPNAFVSENMLQDAVISEDKIKKLAVDHTHVKGITSGNLFILDDVVDGYYITPTTGELALNNSYFTSDFMEIQSETEYTIKYAYQYAFYDINKNHISGVNNTDTNKLVVVKSPPNARLLRVSATLPNKENQVIIKGTTIPSLVPPYKKELPWLNVNEENLDPSFLGKITTNNIEAFLPSEIFVAVGRTIEIYNSQVMPMNPQNYQFAWDCEIGKSMKRKFTVTGTDLLIGEHLLSLIIYDQNLNAVWTGNTTVKIVSNVLSAVRTVLPIGDSLTNNKPWLAEVETLSGNKIDFVGTRVGTGGILHEGRSGYTSGYYLTNRAYNYEPVETVHPFWNPTASRFDWNYYKTSTGINPDEVMIFLGMNELGNAATPTNVKKIVDYIRQDDTDIPVHIVFSQYKGDQNAIGNTVNTDGYTTFKGFYKLDEDLKVLRLMKGLYDLLSGYSNLYFMPVALTHDSENNYGAVETPVNPRATETESIPTDSVHPQTQGYMQFADCIFSVLAAHQ